MNIFTNFITALFKQWIIYLGFIPTIYDLINAYFKYEFEFPQFVIIGFPIGVFIYATYQVYKDEHLKRIDLEKKLDGPTSYKIEAILHPVDFKKDELIKQLEDIKSEIEKKLLSIPQYMEINDFEKYSQISQLILSSSGLYGKTATSYNSELSLYKSKLEEIILNFETYKEKIIARIDELSDTFYFIYFYIENTGITSDSEIQIDINCLNNNIVFNEAEITHHGMDIYKLIPKMPKLPEKPKIQNLSQMISPFNFHAPHLDIPNPNALRKWIEINDNSCSVTIRALHVGDKVNLFNKKLILLKNDNDILFEAIIKSKESTKVLKSNVIFEISDTPKTLFHFEEN